MKLNDDLVRTILLTVEETSTDVLEPRKKVLALATDEITYEVIAYHLKLLQEQGYLEVGLTTASSGKIFITRVGQMTWEGHQFLKNIKNDDVWKKTKKTALEKFGSVSLDILTDVAGAIIRKSLLES